MNLTLDKTFFTSDHHFGHMNIIKYSQRPWGYTPAGQDEMDEHLIANWNRTVPPDGDVFHHGDIFLCQPQRAREIRRRLHGNIYLIVGNHDKTANQVHDLFHWMRDYHFETVRDNGVRQDVAMMHYCMKVWNKSHHGAYHTWGHSHGSLPDDPMALSMDVGIDAIARRLAGDITGIRPETWQKDDYRPISYRELKGFMKQKKFQAIDHHGTR